MRKLVSIDYQEYVKYSQTIDDLRVQMSKFQQEINKLKKEIVFLKDSGENILVIVKDKDKPDIHEYKSNEKNVILSVVQENSNIRERYDELSRRIDNVENQKQMIILKYKEMENIYKDQVSKLEVYVDYLENRSVWGRLKNDIKKTNNINFISYNDQELLGVGTTKTIYSEEEIMKLESEALKVRKPRGWHFKQEFIDTEGNVYNKGKLQPHLKGTR